MRGIRALAFIVPLLLSFTAAAQNTISTIVGGGSPLSGTSPLNAMLGIPESVVEDASGNIYVGAAGSGYVFKIVTSGPTPVISILAGTGYSGIPNSGIPATSATMDAPTGLALDGAGNLYISEIYSNHVFKVNLTTGTLTNFAGNTSASNPVGGYSGDGGPATQASLNTPQGIAFATAGPNAGTLYIADLGNNVIRAVASNGTITTFAGNGTACAAPPNCGDGGSATAASLSIPYGVAVDSLGNVYIADTGDNEVRLVAAGVISLFAGTGSACTTAPACGDNGPATAAQLNYPVGLGVDSGGDVFIADQDDQEVREVNVDGFMGAVAGSYSQGFSGDGGFAGSAQVSDPAGVFVDASGNIFIADQGNNRVREIPTGTGETINTIVGGGTGGDGNPPLQADFSSLFDVTLDSTGKLYVIDNGTSRIRLASGGMVSTIAGDGTAGLFGSLGQTILNYPRGIVKTNGALFIADTFNQVVRASTEVLITYAGTAGQACTNPPNCGDGGPAASALLNMPQGVALDANGNLYIADSGDAEIREVNVNTGNISTVAGNGTACAASTNLCGDGGPAVSANLNFPIGVAVDSAGNIYIADTFDNRIRKVTVATGIISTVAFNGNSSFGGNGGPAVAASMALPNKVVVDPAGNLFIGGGLDEVVQRVDAATQTITTVAGDAQNPRLFGFTGDGGPATSALLSNIGLAVNSTGGLYIADTGNNRVRFVQLSAASTPSPTSLDFGNQPMNIKSSPMSVTITNNGGNDLLITSIADANSFSETNNCPISPNPLAPTQSCIVNVVFTPAGSGTQNDTLIITDNAANSPQMVPLTGVGIMGSVSLAPNGLTFTNQSLGTTSSAQAVTLTNTESTTLTITSIAFTGANAADFSQTNTCGGSLASAGTCTINVKFQPATPGISNSTATLVVTDNVGMQTLTVTGAVQNFSLKTTCTSLTVVQGQTAIYTVDLAPVNGFTQSLTLACTGSPAGGTCMPNPSSITLDGSTTVQSKVTATTTPPTSGLMRTPFDRSNSNRLAGLIGISGMIGLTAILILPGNRRRKNTKLFGWIVCLFLLASAATLSSCGVGGGAADPAATPAGTYPLTVTATFKSTTGTTFTQNVSFNLVVQ